MRKANAEKETQDATAVKVLVEADHGTDNFTIHLPKDQFKSVPAYGCSEIECDALKLEIRFLSEWIKHRVTLKEELLVLFAQNPVNGFTGALFLQNAKKRHKKLSRKDALDAICNIYSHWLMRPDIQTADGIVVKVGANNWMLDFIHDDDAND